MQANMINALVWHRILKVDLMPRYRKVYSAMQVNSVIYTGHHRGYLYRSRYSESSEAIHLFTSPPHGSDRPQPRLKLACQLSEFGIEGIAFMVAYLLALVIKVGLLICCRYRTESILFFLASGAHRNILGSRLQPSRPMLSKYTLSQLLLTQCTTRLSQSWLVFPP